MLKPSPEAVAEPDPESKGPEAVAGPAASAKSANDSYSPKSEFPLVLIALLFPDILGKLLPSQHLHYG